MSCKKDDDCNVDQFVGTRKGKSACTLAEQDTETIVVTKTSDTKLVLNGG